MEKARAQLNRLIETIDRSKPERARLDGEKKVLLQQLQSEFKIKSLKTARVLKKQWEQELEEKKKDIRLKFTELKKAYKW